MDENLITLKGVCKCYDNNPTLENISLDVQRGQIYGYIGPKGSGKSTTIKIILGLLKPSEGSVKVLGTDPYPDNNESFKTRQNIGSLLEGNGLDLNLTGMENLVYCAELYGLNDQNAHKNAVNVIGKVKLSRWADVKVSEYSHSMKKRLCFAKALINDPYILVLDEPLAGLDPESGRIIRNLMKLLVENGKTIFFSTDKLDDIQKISSILYLMNNGKIIFKGTFEKFNQTFGYTKVICQMNTRENAKTKARRIQKFCSHIKIYGSMISFIPREYYRPNLEDKNIIFSRIVESNLETIYKNALSNRRLKNE